MAHRLTSTPAYERLSERLNKFPQGAPASDLLFKILSMLFSEREAELVSLLPLKPFTAQRAAEAWRMGEPEARQLLDALADRGLLIDMLSPDKTYRYFLPPPMVGFFEFSLMRTRAELDQKLLSELYYQYVIEQGDFMENLVLCG
jgi:hypothetical protein